MFEFSKFPLLIRAFFLLNFSNLLDFEETAVVEVFELAEFYNMALKFWWNYF